MKRRKIIIELDVQKLQDSYNASKLHTEIPGRKRFSDRDYEKDYISAGALSFSDGKLRERWISERTIERSTGQEWYTENSSDSDMSEENTRKEAMGCQPEVYGEVGVVQSMVMAVEQWDMTSRSCAHHVPIMLPYCRHVRRYTSNDHPFAPSYALALVVQGKPLTCDLSTW